MIEPSHEARAYSYKRWRLAWLTLFGFFATLIAALFCLASGAFQPQYAWLAGIGGGVATLLLGALTVFTASRLLSRKPGLVLDHEGIIDNSSYSSVGRIPWSEITGVRVVTPPVVRRNLTALPVQAPRFLVVDVRDPQRFIDGSSLLKRWFLRANSAGLGSPVAISPASVHVDTDELAQYIRRIVGTA